MVFIFLFNVEKAIELQKRLAKIVFDNFDSFPSLDYSKLRYIAGLDASYSRGLIHAVAVLVKYPSGELIDHVLVNQRINIPYIPGLLAFREAPGYFRALAKLKYEPDIIYVDGHGLSHPRGFGIATHIGFVLNKPSIGVAKSKLYGELVETNGRVLIKSHGRIVGEVLKHRGMELYVSIGYMIKLEDAVTLTKQLLRPEYDLPIPTALADKYTKKHK